MGSRIIKPGQVFKAHPDEIPDGFKDVVVRVESAAAAESVAEAPVKAEAPVAKAEYFVKSRSAGYYDVVDADGKLMNEKALRKAAAEALIESLQA